MVGSNGRSRLGQSSLADIRLRRRKARMLNMMPPKLRHRSATNFRLQRENLAEMQRICGRDEYLDLNRGSGSDSDIETSSSERISHDVQATFRHAIEMPLWW